jgi:hypothetical protein
MAPIICYESNFSIITIKKDQKKRRKRKTQSSKHAQVLVIELEVKVTSRGGSYADEGVQLHTLKC